LKLECGNVSGLEVYGESVQEVKVVCDNVSGLEVQAENKQGMQFLRFAGARRKDMDGAIVLSLNP
jgi:hypothetical protein